MQPELVEMVCPECFRRLPIECFRLPRTKCVECLQKEKEVNDYLEKKRTLSIKTKELMATVLDENFIPTPGMPQLTEVVSEVYQCFGGPRNFAKRIYDQIDLLMERRPVTSASVNVCLQFMRLQMKLEEGLRQQELADMTDEQLRREQDLGLIKSLLDAAADPKKRQTLDKLMELQGMKLLDIEPLEMFNADGGSQTTEGTPAGA